MINIFQMNRTVIFISILLCILEGSTFEYSRKWTKRNTNNSESCGILKSNKYEEDFCYDVDDVRIKCPPTSNADTIITKYCQIYFRFDGITKTSYRCANGKWIAIDKPCTPECGIKRITAAPIIIRGENAVENEYPWIVAIYDDSDELLCSGTILSPYHVLSAAHCFSDEKGSLRDTSGYKIIAGKYYRDINRVDPFSQTRTIKNISLHEDYRGNFRRYNDDIAVVTLMTEFTFSLEVEPICIDWNSIYETEVLRNGTLGEIAGWGKIQESGKRSTVLNKITVPYRNSEQCWRESPDEFRLNYLVSDKFCAGYINKSIGICYGDSGGGLYFRSNNKYYIRGIASLVVSTARTCSSDHYALYTKVSTYLKWIYSIITSLSVETTLIQTSFPSESSIDDENGCILPEHPLNGSFHITDQDFYIYIPGNLIKQHSLIILKCSNSKSFEPTKNVFCHKSTWYPEIKEDVCKCLEFECDGKVDCEDGSDETKAKCANVRCPASSFRCKYGACIPKSKACDGKKDCADNSDEEASACMPARIAENCNNTQFQCQNGECINNIDTCDGVKTCSDGSDETEETCAGLVCSKFLYRCAYGACVLKTGECDGINNCVDGSDENACPGTEPPLQVTSTTTPKPTPKPARDGCILPTHLGNGRYSYLESVRSLDYVENAYVGTSTSITLSCKEGYRLSGSQFFYCLNKEWLPALNNASCIRQCSSLLSTDSYNSTCYLDGQEVTCENPIDGTVAKTSCKPFYRFDGTRIIPLCRNGNWDTLPTPCHAECGRRVINSKLRRKRVVGGENVLENEYPWVVAIYKNSAMNDKKFICSGSLISRFFVLSGASCLTDSDGVPHPKENFTVVAGKHNHDFSIMENSMQVREIKRLFVHEDYKGQLQKFRDDIALLEIDKLELTIAVQPVCLDWDNSYENSDLVDNNIGVVTGWGFTKEDSMPAEVLKKLLVPYRSGDVCRMYMDPEFIRQFYASDKICAGFKDNSTGICSGDSGGGLYFKSVLETFYVRGIASLVQRSNRGCDTNNYALYTKVSKYLPWIESITQRRV